MQVYFPHSLQEWIGSSAIGEVATKMNIGNKTARRRIAALVVGLLAVALTASACGSGTASTAGSSTAGSSTTEPGTAEPSTSGSSVDFLSYIGKPDPAICAGRNYTIGVDLFSDTDAFAVQLGKGLEKVAGDLGCVKINKLVDNAKPDVAVQNANIFVQQKVDGAILFNVVQAASQGQSQALKAADIPLVSLAVPVDGYPFITNDDQADGLAAGTTLAEAYVKSGKTAKPYAIIGRFDGQDSTKIRMDGAEQGLKKVLPDVEILSIDTKADGPTTQAATAAVLAKIPQGAPILVIGVNDDLTFASVQAVKQAGRSADAMVMALGGVNPVGLKYICENPEYIGAVGYFPENWPAYLIPAIIAEINGVAVPSFPENKILVKTEVISRDNISKFYPDFSC